MSFPSVSGVLWVLMVLAAALALLPLVVIVVFFAFAAKQPAQRVSETAPEPYIASRIEHSTVSGAGAAG